MRDGLRAEDTFPKGIQCSGSGAAHPLPGSLSRPQNGRADSVLEAPSGALPARQGPHLPYRMGSRRYSLSGKAKQNPAEDACDDPMETTDTESEEATGG